MLKIDPQTIPQIKIAKPKFKKRLNTYSKERISTLNKFILRRQVEDSILKNNLFKKGLWNSIKMKAKLILMKLI